MFFRELGHRTASVLENRDRATEKKISSSVEAVAHFLTPPESRRYDSAVFAFSYISVSPSKVKSELDL